MAFGADLDVYLGLRGTYDKGITAVTTHICLIIFRMYSFLHSFHLLCWNGFRSLFKGVLTPAILNFYTARMNSFHIVTQLIILCKKKIKKVTRHEYIRLPFTPESRTCRTITGQNLWLEMGFAYRSGFSSEAA